MSSEWEDEDGNADEHDMYRRMWEQVDDDWDWNALDEEEWSIWDQPSDANPAPPPNDSHFEPHSSSTFNESTPPPRFTRDLPRIPSSPGESRPRDDTFRNLLQSSMGNSSSAVGTRTQQSPPPPPPPPHRHVQTAAIEERRRPVADYSEDWLDHTATDRQSEFGYIPESFFETLSEEEEEDYSLRPTQAREDSDFGIDVADILSEVEEQEEDEDMAPTTRGRRQQALNSVVDLTNDPSSPPQTTTTTGTGTRQPRSLKRAAGQSEPNPQIGRASKRSRRTSPSPTTHHQFSAVEELDLTNEAPSAEEELLQAQQAQAIAAQQAASDDAGPFKIGKRTCIICMEAFTNLTSTHCGHIYCHECLTQALRAGEKNSERGVGNCPVCRKPVNRKKVNQVIPIAFMTKAAWKKGKGRRGLGVLG